MISCAPPARPFPLASSASVPSSTAFPTPDSSRNLRSRFSHLGLASRTHLPPRSLPSHAPSRTAFNLASGQRRSRWDLDNRAGPWQNQHLSSQRFLVLFR